MTAPDLAAVLPGEADFLASVAASPIDDDTRLVYADWLDDHDDPRGAFLRHFVEAARQGTDLPRSDGLPGGWLEIVGATAVACIRELGLDEYREFILVEARPAVALTTHPQPQARFRVGQTRFGGLPSLPRGTPWPRCERGPLEFLAQFDLAEVHRTVAGRVLPAEGLLSFFMYHNYYQDEYGGPEGRGVPDGLRIVHTPAGADLAFLDPPDDLTVELGSPQGRSPCRVDLADALDLPDHAEGWPLFHIESCIPRIDDAPHQLFGFSHVTVLAGDPTPGPDWELLLRFCSDDNLSWGWGDGHRLFWYIRSDDLRALRFDRTVAIDG